METNNNSGYNKSNNIFSFLYRTRVKVTKGDVNVINLSIIFMLVAVCSAPWVAVIGLIAALALGYRFSIKRGDPDFSGDFQDVVKDAAGNVKAAVDSVIGDNGANKNDQND